MKLIAVVLFLLLVNDASFTFGWLSAGFFALLFEESK